MTIGPATQDAQHSDIEAELITFLEGKTRTSWGPDVDLFAEGGLSSMFAMELVVHVEASYGVQVRGADLKLDNFRTVRAMADLVRRLRAAQEA